jgi:PST family polysaccharide transporter
VAELESLASRTAQAAKWRFANAVVGAVSQFGVGILLARLLDPSAFGLVSLAFVVLGAGTVLGDPGVSSAIVQREAITPRHIRAAFTFSAGLGLSVSVLLAVLAPYAAVLTGQPDVAPLLRWLSWSFTLHGCAAVAGGLLRRQLDYRQLFRISTVSYLAGYGAVSVTSALLGFGVWSLVWGGLTQNLLSTVGTLLAARHPLRPLWSPRELRELLRFGVGMSLGGWMNYLARHGDNFVVGRQLGPASLGLYTRAYSLMNLPFTYGVAVMSSVLFPALSRLQDDPARLRRVYLLVTRLTGTVCAPAMATIAVAAPHLITGIYGRRWSGAIVPLQILAAVGYLRVLYHVGGIVAQSAGRVYGEFRNQAIYATLVIAGASIGARGGLPWVAAAVGLAILVMFVLSTQLSLSATGASWRTYARSQVEAVSMGVLTAAALVVVRFVTVRLGLHDAVIALVLVAAGAGAAAAGGLWIASEPEFKSLVRLLPARLETLAEAVGTVRKRVDARLTAL